MENNITKITTPNPFEQNRLPANQASNAVVEIEQSKAIAEVQAAMVIAKRFPRDPIAATDRILNDCTRPKLAESPVFIQPRRVGNNRPQHPAGRSNCPKMGQYPVRHKRTGAQKRRKYG